MAEGDVEGVGRTGAGLEGTLQLHLEAEPTELDAAEKVTFVTLWTPPERLIEQITAADVEFQEKTGKKPSKRHLKVRELYKDSQRILKHYREWFAFTQTKSRDHIVVTLSDELEIRSIDEWESQVAAKVAATPPAA